MLYERRDQCAVTGILIFGKKILTSTERRSARPAAVLTASSGDVAAENHESLIASMTCDAVETGVAQPSDGEQIDLPVDQRDQRVAVDGHAGGAAHPVAVDAAQHFRSAQNESRLAGQFESVDLVQQQLRFVDGSGESRHVGHSAAQRHV